MRKYSIAAIVVIILAFVVGAVLLVRGPATQSDVLFVCRNALKKWNDGAQATSQETTACDTAAKNGATDVQLSLGYAYMKGVGVPKDAAQGVRWFQAAADGGSTDAQYNLGLAYAKGIGVSIDLKQSAQWFLGAATKGDSGAQYALGIMFGLGQGVAKDPVQSYAWFQLAADGGQSDATRSQSEVAKTMSADQLKRAKEHVILFKQRIQEMQKSSGAVSSEAQVAL